MPIAFFRNRFILVGCALVASIVVATGVIMQMYRHSLVEGRQIATANLAGAIAQQTVQMLGPVERALAGLTTDLASNAAADGMGATLRSQALHARLIEMRTWLPAVVAMTVAGADGTILNTADAYPDADRNPSGDDRLSDLPSGDDAAMTFSVSGRNPKGGHPVIDLIQRIVDREGRTAGFAVASISLAEIERSYGAAIAARRVVALFRQDGVMLARYPPRVELIGQKMPPQDGWYGAVAQGGGSYLGPALSGDGLIIASIRRLPNMPLVVETSILESDALASWQQQCLWVVLCATALAIVVVFTMRWLHRHVRRVSASELSLAARNHDLEVARRQFDAVLANMSQGVCFFSGDQRLIVSNRRYGEIYNLPSSAIQPGICLAEIVDHRFAAGSFPDITREEYLVSRDTVAKSAKPEQSVIELKNGRTISIRHQPMPDGGWVATHEDITEQREAEAKIAYMARHDVLTGLANRALFLEQVERALMATGRGTGFAILFLDLDRFKSINDSLGHQVGDKLLRAVAARLRDCVREVDTVARFGGDEFVILQDGAAVPQDAARLAERILDQFGEHFRLGEQDLLVRTSIGVAVAPGDGNSADVLLKNADTALYIAKAEGRASFRFFEPEMDARAQRRHNLEQRLRGAFDRGELELHYQPIVDLRSGMPRAFEALIRWTDPVDGPASPADFIPVAEESGVIVPLGQWVLRQACLSAARWPTHIGVAVNLSPVQFRVADLHGAVIEALENSGLSPNRLELEITETALLQNTETTLKTLHGLRALGVSIVMDDFGVGYSSLSYLRSFPFDKVKIDRSFTSDITSQASALSIVTAVIGLCRDLGMETIVEGVEDHDQLDILLRAKCTVAQGFLFSPAVPADQVPGLINCGALIAGGIGRRPATSLAAS